MTRAIYILSLWLLALVGGGALGLLTLPAYGATVTRLADRPAMLSTLAADPAPYSNGVWETEWLGITGPPAGKPNEREHHGRATGTYEDGGLGGMRWEFLPSTVVQFGIQDARDSRWSTRWDMFIDGAPVYSITDRQPNAGIHWLLVDCGAECGEFSWFTTPAADAGAFDQDGASLVAAPVPLPAAAWLLLAGLAGLFGLRRAR